MTMRYPLLPFLSALLILAGCAQPRQVPRLQNEVGQLNRQLQTLTAQAVVLEQQNALNKQSTGGVYLLPAAQNSAVVQSAIGTLSVSLSHIEAEANGTQALLHIRTLDDAPLPAFRAQLDWGQLDPVSGKPLVADTQTQSFAVSSSLLPKTEAEIALRLSGLFPEQLGFIRLHRIEAQTPETLSAE